jgi:hypothetical protein
VFRALSAQNHQYDLPFQYAGTVINTSFKYQPLTNNQTTLGAKNGYQFLWKVAEAKADKPFVQFTFLNNKSYYTISSLVDDNTSMYFTRLGANDPNFNLRSEPSYIIRKKAANATFVNVVEIHGKYDTNNEASFNAYPLVEKIEMLQNDANYSIAKVTIDKKELVLIQCNKAVADSSEHTVAIGTTSFQWQGAYTVLYQGKSIK